MANENVNIVIKAFDRTRGAFSTATRGITGVARAALSLRTGLVAVAGAGGFAYMVKSSLDATDALSKTASRIGTTTEALSRLQYAGKITGVETNTMSMALQRFTRRSAEAAKGTGEAQGALKELGIDAAQIAQLPLDQQMVVLADAFGGVQSEADKVRLAFKLFDSEGVALVNTLKLGSSGLNNLMAEAETLGLVMSQDAAKGVEEANDSIFRLTSVARGLRDQFVAALAPAIDMLSTKILNLSLDATKSEGGIKGFAQTLAIAFLDLAQNISVALINLKYSLNEVTVDIQAFKDAVTFKSTRSFFSEIFKDADARSAAFHIQHAAEKLEMLEAVINKTSSSGYGMFNGQKMSYEELVDLYQRYQDKIGQMQADQLALSDSDLNASEASKERANAIARLISVFDELRASIKGVKEETGELEEVLVTATSPSSWDTFKAAAQDAFTNVTNGMKSLTQLMEGFVNNSMSSVTNGFTDLITGAKSVKDAFKDMASSIINDLIRMLVQYYITQQIFSAITGAIGGGSPTGGAPAPGKAIGGSVQAGKAYMIGERGQELFIPNQSGSIVANDKLMGGGGVVVNQVINVSTGVQQTVRAEIQNLMPQIANSAKAAVADARMRGGSYSKALVGA